MNETPDLGRPTSWAREKLDGDRGRRTWYGVRKRCIRAWRAGKSRAWICRAFGVSRQWLAKWIRRFQEGGKAWRALEGRTSRPHTVHRVRDAYVDEIHQAKRRWPHLGAAKLKRVAGLALSHDTVHKVLVQLGLVKGRKRPVWRRWRRFQRPFPNYLWQCDITQLPTPEGVAHVITLLDDCTRFVLATSCYGRDLTAGDAVGFLQDAFRLWGRPRQLLTDRGTQFHSQQALDPSPFTLFLHAHGVQHIRARPRHPRTLGKIERWHRSFKEEWCDHHAQPRTLGEVRDLLAGWVTHYNTERPHWALKYRVPVELYAMGLSVPDDLFQLVNEVS